MQIQEDALFVTDDAAWWMGKLTQLVLTWIAFAGIMGYYRFDFSVFIHDLREGIRFDFLPEAMLLFVAAITAYMTMEIIASWARDDRKLLFFPGRIVRLHGRKPFDLEKIDEGFFLSALMTGDYTRIGKRASGYRYLRSALLPLMIPVCLAVKLASLAACLLYMFKLRDFSFDRVMLFPHLALVNAENERLVLMLLPPNRESVLEYLHEHLYADPSFLPRYFALTPPRTRNLKEGFELRALLTAPAGTDARNWYRSAESKKRDLHGMDVQIKVG